ncbi:uncharacterized protein PHALS_12843 [Plasmopara halstedii]|uniref:Uncharacterized protein n=1 Tax=Plasmopara halstedii TaxID=4781 RepID=A0A0P1ANA1_PLAHL|nr:uncharacterized protein PHALS_12843 [Plasmopara halstedii]CEG42581.1 hypothetical protein PHALS_12843 [Plasmopara halstedii]|eukprot:XP_024578950.1 hypothetical protein PHALS_12843 [Plasmopara halstedii]
MKDVYFDVTQIEINCALTAHKADDVRFTQKPPYPWYRRSQLCFSCVVVKVEPSLDIGSWTCVCINTGISRLKSF